MELTTEMVYVDADAKTKKRKGLSLSRAYVYYHEHVLLMIGMLFDKNIFSFFFDLGRKKIRLAVA